MRKIMTITLGLLLIAGMALSDPLGPAETAKDPGQKGLKLGFVDAQDAVHSCGGDSVDNVNEVNAVLDVSAHVYQSYKVSLTGFKVNVQKWEVGEVEFKVTANALGQVWKDYLPKFEVTSNNQHLVSLCCVKNPEDGCANELVTAYRLVNAGGAVKVSDAVCAAQNCVLCKEVKCSCGEVLYAPDHCTLCTTCSHKGAGAGCSASLGYNMKGSGNTGNVAGWVEEGEFGVNDADGGPGTTETYYLEVYAKNEWSTPTGDYTGGEVKVVFHPQM